MLDKKDARNIALQYAQIVHEALAPKSIVLFGSYINGTPTEESDIDIAVIFEGFQGNWLEPATLLSCLKRQVNFLIEPHLLGEEIDVTGFINHVKKLREKYYFNQNKVLPQISVLLCFIISQK